MRPIHAFLALCRTSAGAVAACAVELVGEKAPEWIEVLAEGEILARDGRKWTMPDAAAVIAATQARIGSTDMVIDYEHQTLHAANNGREAPAAGWIKSLEVRDGAIWAKVEWTGKAAAAIEAKEYRYFSPVFTHTKNGRVKALVNGALTNNPALDLTALATSQPPENRMDLNGLLKALCQALGLGENTAAETLVTAVTALADGRKALAKALGKDGSATDDDLVAAARARAPSPGEYVPRAEFDTVAAQLKTLQDEGTENRATAAVDAAVAAGKITPAQKDWALAYAKSDAEGFADYVEGAPVIVAPGTRPGRNAPPADADAPLTDEERAVCKTLGIDEEKFKASRKKDLRRLGGEG